MSFNPKPEYITDLDKKLPGLFYKDLDVDIGMFIHPLLKYQADHVIPHAKGGKTVLENAELLCSYHNQSKGSSINENTSQ